MQTILVTGGAGFIGSNFLKLIYERYPEIRIVNLDILSYAGNYENIKDLKENRHYRFVKGSITDEALLKQLFLTENFNYVVNFAAESHVDRSIENPSIFTRTNVLGTQNLIDVSKKAWQIGNDKFGYPIYKENAKFIQVSTDEVYGTLDEIGKFTEKSPIAPNSPYSASKASSDLLVRAYYETFKFPMNITRCSNNYGPNQFPEKLIPLMIKNCIANEKIPLYGDGLQIRDWLHVSDHCEAILAVLCKGRIGEVYNVGGNNEKTNLDVTRLIINTLGKSETLIEYVQDRLGHDRRYAIDNRKITLELGWRPKYTFELGIKETIQWYLKNDSWLKNIVEGSYLNSYDRLYGKQEQE